MTADKPFYEELEEKLVELIAETQRLNDKMEAYIQASEKFHANLTDFISNQTQPGSGNQRTSD